jgi:carbon storage regulator
MLILSRKLDEQIVIAGNIYIKVIELNGRTVKLGIEAPRDIEVMRAELLENDAATSPSISAAL